MCPTVILATSNMAASAMAWAVSCSRVSQVDKSFSTSCRETSLTNHYTVGAWGVKINHVTACRLELVTHMSVFVKSYGPIIVGIMHVKQN